MSVFGVILVHIFSAFSLIRTEYEEIISPYSVQMRENVGKMGTRITPNTENFYTQFKSLSTFYTVVIRFQTGQTGNISFGYLDSRATVRLSVKGWLFPEKF